MNHIATALSLVVSVAAAASCARGLYGPSVNTPVSGAPRQLDTLTVWERHALLDRAEVWRPDIAVLDVGLPGMNGYEVASALRQRGESCPELIAVTGYGQAADTKRAFEAGFRFHLVKPVDARDLTTAIAHCAVSRQARR